MKACPFKEKEKPLGTQLANLSNAKLELLYALETSVEHSEDQYTQIHQQQGMANYKPKRMWYQDALLTKAVPIFRRFSKALPPQLGGIPDLTHREHF